MTRTIIAGLDIETTGLSQPDGHRIIEVALILYDLDKAVELGRYETRVNPQRGIDPDAQAVHGISYDELIDKPTWEEVAPKLASLLERCHYVVAHNGLGFDAPFVWGEFLRVGVALPETRIVDTLVQGRWATADGSIPNLEALCWACEVAYDKALAHAATYDVEVMMHSFFRAHRTGFITLPTEPYVYKVPKKEKK